MSIRTDEPLPNSSSVVLLVEDLGLRKFFPTVLNAISVSGAKCDVHVVGGEGWNRLYQKYNELIDSGVDAAQIIPVLDADTLGRKKGPISNVH
jgi:hypothetical protein